MANLSLGSKLTFKEVNQFVDDVSVLVKAGEKSLAVNMESCQYLNSLMLSGLIRAQKICNQQDCIMTLQEVSASAMTLFETTNVLSLFTITGQEPDVTQVEKLELSFQELSNEQGVFVLKGNLNNPDQCAQFRDFYDAHLSDIRNGILDCLELDHLGSTGVTEMFRIRGLLEEKTGKLIIVSQTDSVESIWRMMHLDSLIPKTATVEEAVAFLSQQ